MKLKGKTIPLNIVTAVIPREDGDLIFRFGPVSDLKQFEELCPEPKLIYLINKNGERILDDKDKENLKKIAEHNELRAAYMFLCSIAVTEGLEWEKVSLSDPSTWVKYREELLESLSLGELNRLHEAMMEANGLSEEKMEEARKRFLATQQAAQ